VFAPINIGRRKGERVVSRSHVIIIASKDDLDFGWGRSISLKKELEKRKIPVQLINKLGFVYDDLHVVAKHRVVTTPTILVMKNDRVIIRKAALMSAQSIAELMEAVNA